jgi:polyisoprenoid-binding protein YceI
MRYAIHGGTMTVRARSRVHDVTTVWSKLTGEVDADPETVAVAGATALVRVDMTAFDAGDWLRNRKLRKDFDLDAHPEATFELRALRGVARTDAGFSATAEGVLRWRGRELAVAMQGRGRLDATSLSASATVELDLRRLGLAAPRFLLLKMEDEVAVDVQLQGTARP